MTADSSEIRAEAGGPLGPESPADPLEAPAAASEEPPLPATPREYWGWFLYDFAANAFYSVAIPIFFPLLLTTLANQQAYAELGQAAVPDCTSSQALPCLLCVPGKGTQLNTTSGLQPYSQPGVTAGALHIDPVSFATASLGIAVLCQVLVFITLGPLADFGNGRRLTLIWATAFGSLALVLSLCLVSPSLWWLAGVLLVLSNVAFGLAYISYYSYLAVLVEASPEVIASSDAAGFTREEKLAVREKVSNRVSLVGVSVGNVGAILCTGIAASLTLSTPNQNLQLQLATAFAGLWWMGFSLFTFCWVQSRPGPPLPSWGFSLFSGWTRLARLFMAARKYRNALCFLLCYFIYADGAVTLTQIGVLFAQQTLCMDNTSLILLVASVSVWGLFGCALAYLTQRVSGLHNKTMVLIVLSLMLLLPLWGLLGYVTPPGSFGLENTWEIYVFAAWFGLLLGPMYSFSRVLFIDLIPVGSEALFFSLYALSDKGSSWLGPFFAALVVQFTGSLRPSFLYILVVNALGLTLLAFLVNHKQGMLEAGRIKDSSAPPAE